MAKALFPLHGIARLDLTHFCFQELFLILFSSADSNPSKWTEFLADHGSNLVSNHHHLQCDTDAQKIGSRI